MSRGEEKTFGLGAQTVNDKIFSKVSSAGEFVMKLPKTRVAEFVNSGNGNQFDPGHGRLIRDWVVLAGGKANWGDLAKEAYEFVRRSL